MVLWCVHDGKATVLKQWSIPLPGVSSAPQSEAAGSAHAVKVLADWMQEHPQERYDFFLIQGDNLAVINSWTGRGTLKQSAMHDLLADAHRIARYLLVNLEWEYIPRDINKHADYLAGIASQLVKLTNSEMLTNSLAPFEEVAPFTFDTDTWQANAIVALTHGHAQVLLVEKLDLSMYAADLMARMPDKCSTLPAMLANQRTIGASTPYPVLYRTNNAEAQGRCYAWTAHSAFRASKALRTLAAGQTHVELDVVGAHLSFALLISPRLARTFGWGTVRNARDALVERFTGTQFALHNPTYYKDILTRALNVRKGRHLEMLSHQGLFYGEPLVNDLLTIIDAAKPEIVHQAARLGFRRHDPRVNEANEVYFAFEFIEGIFMRRFIASILQSTQVTSLSWIHDGIWVSPSPSSASRKEATKTANKALHVLLLERANLVAHTTIVMGFTNLNGARDGIIKFIKVGAPNDALRPCPAESQDAVEHCVHEYDYRFVEHECTADVHLHRDRGHRHAGKRKLPCQDSPNTINNYFKRQGITPA